MEFLILAFSPWAALLATYFDTGLAPGKARRRHPRAYILENDLFAGNQSRCYTSGVALSWSRP